MPSCEWNPYFISSNFSFFHHRSERWLMLLFCSVLSEAHSVCALHIHFQPCCNCHDREMTFSSHYLLFICLSGLICHTVSLWHFLWFVLAVAMELWHIVTQRHRRKCKCRPCLSLDAAALTSPRLQSWRPWLFFFLNSSAPYSTWLHLFSEANVKLTCVIQTEGFALDYCKCAFMVWLDQNASSIIGVFYCWLLARQLKWD